MWVIHLFFRNEHEYDLKCNIGVLQEHEEKQGWNLRKTEILINC